MLIYLVSATVCIAFGAYATLLVMGLCMASSSAERSMASPIGGVDSMTHNTGTCSRRERTVFNKSRPTRIAPPPGSTTWSRHATWCSPRSHRHFEGSPRDAGQEYLRPKRHLLPPGSHNQRKRFVATRLSRMPLRTPMGTVQCLSPSSSTN
jgi:hypothetical protein